MMPCLPRRTPGFREDASERRRPRPGAKGSSAPARRHECGRGSPRGTSGFRCSTRARPRPASHEELDLKRQRREPGRDLQPIQSCPVPPRRRDDECEELPQSLRVVGPHLGALVTASLVEDDDQRRVVGSDAVRQVRATRTPSLDVLVRREDEGRLARRGCGTGPGRRSSDSSAQYRRHQCVARNTGAP